MKRKCLMLLIAGVIMLQLAGCGNNKKEAVTEAATESVVDHSEEEKEEVVIKTEETEPAVEYITEPAELVCVLPDGFVAAPDEEGLYVHRTYPTDISTISYVISEGEEDLTEIDVNAYETDIEASFYDTYGDEVDVTVTAYERVAVDNRKGLKIKITYDFKGVGYEQLIYMIYNGTETHIMNYTQESGGEWMEEFEKSGASIWFKAFEE